MNKILKHFFAAKSLKIRSPPPPLLTFISHQTRIHSLVDASTSCRISIANLPLSAPHARQQYIKIFNCGFCLANSSRRKAEEMFAARRRTAGASAPNSANGVRMWFLETNSPTNIAQPLERRRYSPKLMGNIWNPCFRGDSYDFGVKRRLAREPLKMNRRETKIYRNMF